MYLKINTLSVESLTIFIWNWRNRMMYCFPIHFGFFCEVCLIEFVYKLRKELKLSRKSLISKLLHRIINQWKPKEMIKDPVKYALCRLAQTEKKDLVVESVCDITFIVILRINQSCKSDSLITVIIFLVHKEWLLLLSLYNALRHRTIALSY